MADRSASQAKRPRVSDADWSHARRLHGSSPSPTPGGNRPRQLRMDSRSPGRGRRQPSPEFYIEDTQRRAHRDSPRDRGGLGDRHRSRDRHRGDLRQHRESGLRDVPRPGEASDLPAPSSGQLALNNNSGVQAFTASPPSTMELLALIPIVDKPTLISKFLEFAASVNVGQLCIPELTATIEFLALKLDCPGALLHYRQDEFMALAASINSELGSPGIHRTLGFQLWQMANNPPLPPSPDVPQFPPPPPAPSAETLASSIAFALRQPPPPRKNGILAEVENEDDSGLFDLARFLKKSETFRGDFDCLDLGWFADLRKLHALDTEARRRNYRLLASTGFEEWNPQWLGLDKPTSVRKAMHSERTKSLESSGLARVLGNITTFWLSHAAVGLVSLPAAFAHFLLLMRLADERSVKFVLAYERRLMVRMLERIRSGEKFKFCDCISHLDSRIVDRLDIEEARPERVSKPLPKEKPRDTRLRPPVTPRDNKAPVRRRSASKDRKRSPPRRLAVKRERTPPRAPKRSPASDRRPLCLEHDPASRKTCPLGSRCPKEHLDTKDPALKARFDKVALIVESRRPKTSG